MRESVVRERLEWMFPELREQLLGGADADTVEAELERLGAERCFFVDASIGALFGIELADGGQVALKVHQARVSEADLDAMQSVQRHLVDVGFPCPRPVVPPTPFLGRIATGEEWRDEGESVDVVDDEHRAVMAAHLARQIELCSDLPSTRVLTWVPDDEHLWPTPHNALFDFDAPGGEWIDEIARAAKARNRAGPRVLAHQDWTTKHFRWHGLEPSVVYDWDALFTDNESISVGAAAVTHTYPNVVREPWAGAVDTTIAFLDAYEQARRLAPETRRAAEAHAVYSVAYGARCEQGFVGGEPATRERSVLREFAEEFL